MNKENCALKLVDEIILYYDARSKKHQIFLYGFLINELLTMSHDEYAKNKMNKINSTTPDI